MKPYNFVRVSSLAKSQLHQLNLSPFGIVCSRSLSRYFFLFLFVLTIVLLIRSRIATSEFEAQNEATSNETLISNYDFVVDGTTMMWQFYFYVRRATGQQRQKQLLESSLTIANMSRWLDRSTSQNRIVCVQIQSDEAAAAANRNNSMHSPFPTLTAWCLRKVMNVSCIHYALPVHLSFFRYFIDWRVLFLKVLYVLYAFTLYSQHSLACT